MQVLKEKVVHVCKIEVEKPEEAEEKEREKERKEERKRTKEARGKGRDKKNGNIALERWWRNVSERYNDDFLNTLPSIRVLNSILVHRRFDNRDVAIRQNFGIHFFIIILYVFKQIY